MVLLFFIYVAAVPIVQVVIDYRLYERSQNSMNSITDQSYDYLAAQFQSLPDAMVCLFQNITSGLSWAEIYTALKDLSALGSVVHLAYIAFAALALLNVITGVFLEKVKKVSEADKDFLIINTVRDLFRDERSGLSTAMSFDGFMEKIAKPEMLQYFE